MAVGAAPSAPAPSAPPPPVVVPQPQLPSVWQQIQPALNRNRGESTALPTPDYIRMPPSGERRLPVPPLPDGLDRASTQSAESRVPLASLPDENARRMELDRREYQLYLNDGLSTASAQALDDIAALTDAKAKRNEGLFLADQQESDGLAAHPSDHGLIVQTYQRQVALINQAYQRERVVILGDAPSAATQPAKP